MKSVFTKVPATQPMRRACYIAEANYYHALAMELDSNNNAPNPIDPSDSAACQGMAKEMATPSTAAVSGQSGNAVGSPTGGNTSIGATILSATSPSAEDMPATALATGVLAQANASLSIGTENTIAAVAFASDLIGSLFKGKPDPNARQPFDPNECSSYSATADALIPKTITQLDDVQIES